MVGTRRAGVVLRARARVSSASETRTMSSDARWSTTIVPARRSPIRCWSGLDAAKAKPVRPGTTSGIRSIGEASVRARCLMTPGDRPSTVVTRRRSSSFPGERSRVSRGINTPTVTPAITATAATARTSSVENAHNVSPSRRPPLSGPVMPFSRRRSTSVKVTEPSGCRIAGTLVSVETAAAAAARRTTARSTRPAATRRSSRGGRLGAEAPTVV